MDKETNFSAVLLTKFANPLKRNGIHTIGHLIDKIQVYGIKILDTGSVYFPGDSNYSGRGAGKKTWEAALHILDDYGFNWRNYTPENYPYLKDTMVNKINMLRQINMLLLEIKKTNKLLEIFLANELK